MVDEARVCGTGGVELGEVGWLRPMAAGIGMGCGNGSSNGMGCWQWQHRDGLWQWQQYWMGCWHGSHARDRACNRQTDTRRKVVATSQSSVSANGAGMLARCKTVAPRCTPGTKNRAEAWQCMLHYFAATSLNNRRPPHPPPPGPADTDALQQAPPLLNYENGVCVGRGGGGN